MKPPWQFVSLCELCSSELTRDLRTGVAHQKADANAMQRCIRCSIDICNSCQYNAIYVRTIHTYFHIYHILSDMYIYTCFNVYLYIQWYIFIQDVAVQLYMFPNEPPWRTQSHRQSCLWTLTASMAEELRSESWLSKAWFPRVRRRLQVEKYHPFIRHHAPWVRVRW